MKKIRLILLGALLSVTALTACNGGTPADTDNVTKEDSASVEETAPPADIALAAGGATEYTIVRSDTSSSSVTEAAVYLRKYMEKCGLKPKITTDWEKNEVSDYEIIVGDSLRTAEQGNTFDAHSVGPDGYYVLATGTRIYIGGGSDASVMAGVEAFLTEFFGYTGDADTAAAVTDVTVPGGYADIHQQSFALSDITVNGVSLRDYAIVLATADSTAKSSAKTMQSQFYNECGIWLDIVANGTDYTGPAIILSGDAPKKDGYYEISLNGQNVVICVSGLGGYSRGFSQFFKDTIEGKTGTLSLDALSYELDIASTVTYSQFGAKGDGVTDDMAAIIATHEYANANGVAVKADPGATYYIGLITSGAVIQTDVDWTDATFIIDDSVVGTGSERNVSIFTVKSSYQSKKLSGLTTLSAGQENLGITLDQPSIVVVTNSSKKQYIREGINANSGSDQTDIILVDTDGSIDQRAPIMWDYDKITSATVTPIDTETLSITGGTFITIANQAPSYYTYYYRGIKIQRSNVVVDGFTHYIEGEGDHGAPYNGVILIQDCANVTVKNCTFTAHKTYQSQDPNQASQMGSYDIAPSRSINLTFENCTQTTDILDTAYWGLIGSNFCKNIVLDGCNFSRFDAHQGVANVTIRNCTLGHQCLNAIGSGTLTVEGSTLYGSSFINLRSDYGSTWHGDVIIKDCTWIPNCGKGVSNGTALIGGSYTGFHDFGYECYMPTTITIDGLHVVDSKRGAAYKGINLLGNIVSSWTSENYEKKVAAEGYPYHVTETITIRNFTSDSGKKWNLSQNTYMYRNVEVIDLDAAN